MGGVCGKGVANIVQQGGDAERAAMEKSICGHVVSGLQHHAWCCCSLVMQMHLSRLSTVAFLGCTDMLEHRKHGSPVRTRLTSVGAFEHSW